MGIDNPNFAMSAPLAALHRALQCCLQVPESSTRSGTSHRQAEPPAAASPRKVAPELSEAGKTLRAAEDAADQRSDFAPLVAVVRGGTAHTRARAAGALRTLATDHADNQVAIIAAGAFAALMELSHSGTNRARENALAALQGLYGRSLRQAEAAAAKRGEMGPLVELTKSGMDRAEEHAAEALWHLAHNHAGNRVAIAAADGIAPLVELTRSGTPLAKEMAAAALQNLAYNNADNRVAIAEAGGIPLLIELTRTGTARAEERAAGALRNLVRLNNDDLFYEYDIGNQKAIAATGGIAPLVELTRTGTARAKEQALEALRVLAKSNAANGAAMLQLGFEP